MNAAWHHAARIRQPLNVLVSLRPLDIDTMDPVTRCKLFTSFRNKLGGYARSHHFAPTLIWSREANLDGAGEHLHVLMHVPRRHQEHFEDTLVGWYPGPAEMDIRTAHQRTTITENGKRYSAVGYISKQMTPQAWYKRGLERKKGGPIFGKRGGSTANLNWRARAAFRSTWNTPPRSVPVTTSTTVNIDASRKPICSPPRDRTVEPRPR